MDIIQFRFYSYHIYIYIFAVYDFCTTEWMRVCYLFFSHRLWAIKHTENPCSWGELKYHKYFCLTLFEQRRESDATCYWVRRRNVSSPGSREYQTLRETTSAVVLYWESAITRRSLWLQGMCSQHSLIPLLRVCLYRRDESVCQ